MTWPFVIKVQSCGEKVWCKIIADDQLHEWKCRWILLINENNEIIVLSNYMSILRGNSNIS